MSAWRLLRTLAWLRWRIVAGALRAGNRGRVEHASRVLQGAVTIVLGAVVVAFSLALAAGVVFAASRFDDPRLRTVFGVAAAMALSIASALIVVFAGSSGVGETLASARLLLLPVRRTTLHALELVAALGDPFVAVLMPALLAFPIALGVGGRPGLALVAAAAGGLMLLVLAALSSAAAGWLQLLLRSRRRREAFLLVAAIGFTLLSVGPSLWHWSGGGGARDAAAKERIVLDARTWGTRLRVLPPGLYAAAVTAAAERGAAAALPRLGGLLASAAALAALALVAQRRLAASPPSNARRAATAGPVLRALPGGTARGTLAAAQLRSLLRTTPARTALVMTPLVTWLMARNLGRVGSFVPAGRLAIVLVGPMVLLGVGQLLVNQFAFDGDGLARQVLLPVDARGLIAARRTASLAYVAMVAAPATLLVALAGSGFSPWMLGAMLFGTAAAARILVPVAILLAAWLPKTVDPSRLGRASQPHQGAALAWIPLVGTLVGPLWGLGALLGTMAGPAAVLAAAAVLFIATLWIAPAIEQAAARAFLARRESLLLVAGGR